jgi:hypothetical protein
MFDTFYTIDIHDHYRQGSLEFERYLISRDRVTGIFGAILGMIMVNSYNCYLYFFSFSTNKYRL